MEPMRVRFATLDDAPAICTIYNQGIDDRVATLETELRDADERRRWLSSRGTRYPVLVAEARGQIIGWSSLNSFNPRRAYDHVADISVYVERSWRGRGAGRVLLERLIELGRELQFHKLVLACFPTNKAGVALYERMGFAHVGIYREQGLLDGRWVDVLVMERLFEQRAGPTYGGILTLRPEGA
jgi:phosphinothricin acetyltransferase